MEIDNKTFFSSKPEGFEDSLSGFREVIFDPYCGEPVGWGFKVMTHLGEERFNSLRKYGSLVCVYPEWYLVTKMMNLKEAEERFGKVTDLELGPRGGFRSVTLGNKKFKTKFEGL